MDITSILVAVIGSGGVFGYVTNREKAHHKKISELEEHNKKCDSENNEIKRRLMSLEISGDTGWATWRKTSNGIYIYVNAEYVRLILAPFGKTSIDILNKRDEEIDFFNPEIVAIHKELDRRACLNQFAIKSHVKYHEKTFPMTVLKRSVADNGNSQIFLEGLACPEI